ncbi:DUF6522 family protein [Methylobacterium durans]|uniref:Uncharacterized protein n=1 Tax=Methylobacterium durans TaxID=2202825 RepID=A0A2U8W2V8_9HYPH|nr:DUF6522 family protein [Methylobacterium durans]AWN39961.1 hypothetical protein DK389_04655 [Methylobacterium durans]
MEGTAMRFSRNWRGQWVFDPTEFAAKLGITPERFQAEIDLELIRLLVEKGRGEDTGRSRITVRSREAAWQGIIDGQGYVLNECRLSMDQLPEQLMR